MQEAQERNRIRHEKEMQLDYYERKTSLEKLKSLARTMLRDSVKSGLVLMPNKCELCDGVTNKRTKKKLEAHHYDYTRPLDVFWLCFNCHYKVHRG